MLFYVVGSSDFHDFDGEEASPVLAFASGAPVVSAVKGRTTLTRSCYIEEAPPPKTVFYGTSHIGRLLKWKLNVNAMGGPNDIEQKLLRESKFIYSGGSKWYNIHDRVQGKGVPLHQRQGDTWGKVLHEINVNGFKPEYVVVCCLANQLCELNDWYYDEVRRSDCWHMLVDSPYGPSEYYKQRNRHWFDDRVRCPLKPKQLDQLKFMNKHKAKIEGHIKTVVSILKSQFSGCKFFYIGAINRLHWFPCITNLISYFNKHMRDTHGMQLCCINRFLRKKHMESDLIHLNREGYKLLLSKGLGPYVDHHLSRYCKFDKRVPIEQCSKSSRKRLYSRIRNANARKAKLACRR